MLANPAVYKVDSQAPLMAYDEALPPPIGLLLPLKPVYPLPPTVPNPEDEG